MKLALRLLAACVVLTPCLASEPGQPLDCSNFVFLVPGFSCEEVCPPYAPGGINGWCTAGPQNSAEPPRFSRRAS